MLTKPHRSMPRQPHPSASTPRRGDVAVLSIALWVVLAMFSWLAPAEAVSSGGTSDFLVDGWQTEDGLPQSSVLSFAQTPDGYLWMATYNGLARFDGARFTVFDTSNLPGLPSNRLLRLFAERAGGLWIVTEQHDFARLENGRCRQFHAQDGLPASGVQWAGADGQGTIWTSGATNGLWRLTEGKFAQVAMPETIAEAPVRSMVPDTAGRLWFVRYGRVFGFRDGRVETLALSADARDVVVRYICACKDGGLWLLTTNGLRKFQGESLLSDVWPVPDDKMNVVAWLEDRAGGLWVATYDNGLFRFTPADGWQHFGLEAGLSTLSLRSLFQDREGNLWVGTDGGGVLRIKPRSWRMITRRDGLGVAAVHSLCQDSNGRIWFAGGTTKPYLLDNGAISVAIPAPKSDVLDGVWAVLPARNGTMWIGTYRGQVFAWRDGALTRYASAEGMLAGSVRGLMEDRQGALWVGGYAGLCRIADGKVTNFTKRDGLSSEKVWALAEDFKGAMFVGTSGGGLNCFRDGRFTVFTRKDGLPSDSITALYADAQDVLWIGTHGGGLVRLKEGRFFSLAMKGGLPACSVGAILEDDNGFLWVSSGLGILRVSKGDLNSFADGRQGSIQYVVSDRNDGLTTLEIGNVQPSCWKSRDGKLWFGTSKGAACADPKKLHVNAVVPQVLIEEVRIDDRLVTTSQSVPVPQEATTSTTDEDDGDDANHPAMFPVPPPAVVRVLPGQSRVEFRFTALSLTAPPKIRFRYKLEGLDADWTETSARRLANYTRLPAGNYRFRVTACNDSGVWSEAGAAMELIVLSPWYRTWWVYALEGLLTASLVIWWYERRLLQLQRNRAAQAAFSRQLIASQEQERKRIAAELHDTIGQNLLIIKNRAVLGLQVPALAPAAAEQLGEVSRAASQAIQEIREVSYNLRPYQLDRLGLTKALQTLVQRVADSAAIPICEKIDPVDKLIPPEGEINLYRIVQEALSNIVKHSDAATASVTVRFCGATLRLIVEDDGRGFDYAALQASPTSQRGFGLSSMAERVRILDGRLNYDSAPGQGARLTVEVPVAHANESSPTQHPDR